MVVTITMMKLVISCLYGISEMCTEEAYENSLTAAHAVNRLLITAHCLLSAKVEHRHLLLDIARKYTFATKSNVDGHDGDVVFLETSLSSVGMLICNKSI